MKFVLSILRLIPVKKLVKYLPEVLAFVLTKVLTWTFKKYPHKAPATAAKMKEVVLALTQNIDAASDGEISKVEVSVGISLWKEVFD